MSVVSASPRLPRPGIVYTPQQRADRLLACWQANRHLPPAQRLAANDDLSLDALDATLERVAGAMAVQ